MADSKEVAAFLGAFHARMKAEGLYLWRTRKNDEFLLETGFLNEDVEDIIKSLRPQEYSRGPEADDNASRKPGEVWVFSKEWEGYDLYLKLKMSDAANAPSLECLSCHEQAGRLREPLRTKRIGG